MELGWDLGGIEGSVAVMMTLSLVGTLDMMGR